MTVKSKVLFLCTGNSCRSQMAEGWARHLKGDSIEAWSAGTKPHAVDPRAIKVMAEAGVDISGQASKHALDIINIPFDLVVTVCDAAREACPIFPGRMKIVHRGFEDPPRMVKSDATEEEILAHYRRIRDEIRDFVKTLPDAYSTPE